MQNALFVSSGERCALGLTSTTMTVRHSLAQRIAAGAVRLALAAQELSTQIGQ